MIALLVGVLVAETAGKWKLVGDLPKEGKPLETGREAYGDLKLVRIVTPTQENRGSDTIDTGTN